MPEPMYSDMSRASQKQNQLDTNRAAYPEIYLENNLSGEVSSEHEGAAAPFYALKAVPSVVRRVGALLLVHAEAQALIEYARLVVHPQNVHKQGLCPCTNDNTGWQSLYGQLKNLAEEARVVENAVEEMNGDSHTLHWFARSTAL